MNKSKQFGILLLVLNLVMLTGCSRQATSKDIETAERLCAVNDGMKFVQGNTDFQYGIARCNNGARFMFNDKGEVVNSGE